MIWNWKTFSFWQRLRMALLIVAVASTIRAVFFGGLGRGLPQVIFYPAVMLAALFGGLLAGILATALAAALCCFWIQQSFISPVERPGMIVFLIGCTMISVVCEVMLRARSRAGHSANASGPE
jgi:two-component system CheB/CheR fusion protein